jgi:hypothetical protein
MKEDMNPVDVIMGKLRLPDMVLLHAPGVFRPLRWSLKGQFLQADAHRVEKRGQDVVGPRRLSGGPDEGQNLL